MSHFKGYTKNDLWMLHRMKDNCPKELFEQLICRHIIEDYTVSHIYQIAYDVHHVVPWPPWW